MCRSKLSARRLAAGHSWLWLGDGGRGRTTRQPISSSVLIPTCVNTDLPCETIGFDAANRSSSPRAYINHLVRSRSNSSRHSEHPQSPAQLHFDQDKNNSITTIVMDRNVRTRDRGNEQGKNWTRERQSTQANRAKKRQETRGQRERGEIVLGIISFPSPEPGCLARRSSRPKGQCGSNLSPVITSFTLVPLPHAVRLLQSSIAIKITQKQPGKSQKYTVVPSRPSILGSPLPPRSHASESLLS